MILQVCLPIVNLSTASNQIQLAVSQESQASQHIRV
jgi:hypothetical protein